MGRWKRSGFSIVELLVVCGIIAGLSAIALGVIGQVREKARQSACLSNARQVGMAMLQYAQDYDDNLPSGTQGSGTGNTRPGGNGAGWAGQVYPHVRDVAVFRCPSEGSFRGIPGLRNLPGALSPNGVVVSYGYNGVLPIEFTSRAVGGMLARLNRPAETVMLFEVSGCIANIRVPDENDPPDVKVHSAAGMGRINPTVGREGFGNLYGVRYATGNIGGLVPEPAREYAGVKGRHSGGANYVLVDGHARWLRPERVLPAGLPQGTPQEGYTAYFINRDR